MKISTAFPSKYLRAADLDGRQVAVEIASIEMEDVATGEEPKPVLYFVGKSKGVVMNKTNANTIAAAYGDDTDAWMGQPITLFSAHVQFQSRMVEAIRIKVPPRKPSPPPPQIQGRALDDDDIPF